MWLTGLDKTEKDFVRRALCKLRGLPLRARARLRRQSAS
jgi:hypothetical protein